MCAVNDCTDTGRLKRGWCEFHYGRWLRYGDPLAGGPRRAAPNTLDRCVVDGCGKRAIGQSLCGNHYRRLSKYGDPLGGHYEQTGKTTRWHKDRNGYVRRFDRKDPNAGPNGFVYQHREVMAGTLGRPLSGDESVHHKNGDRADNRPENLELWVRSQPAGQRVQDLLEWANEIIRRYGAGNSWPKQA